MRPVPAAIRGRSSMFYTDAQGGHHSVEAVACPECSGIFLTHADLKFMDGPEPGTATSSESGTFILLPRVSSRPAIPPEVPEPYASLAREAGLILPDSPRASAALSRRCLQQLLRDVAGAPPGSLYAEIEWAMKNAALPSHATEALHDLRVIGNMAAHPNKSTATGDYLDVEPGEAEWTLDTLDGLFDYYFVSPARTAARKASLAAKLGKIP
jgi:hypothetical protein